MSSEETIMSSPGTIVSSDGKSGGFSQPQTEKPFHYTYLKEFRVDQCPLFLQHKCTAHRPFTCFNWHFMNQRRRRPKKKRDGTFNYSPDVYCSQYDETTGICPSGDDCPYLHRVAGDVERRYHLRYYKTATCVHETDARGYCVKNGPHCAFAHGPHDLRQPVYDVRELQGTEKEEADVLQGLQGLQVTVGVESRAAIEDARWQDTNFVLSSYKTEPCKKPPRLCRQGYACPHYHNSRDRRRSPRKCRYRSTPCPHVKHGDEWGEPSNCEHGDGCPYCHTRTEQQFHPEIYKSTKCNDMQQTGYCPRGPFCAFAHVDQESGLFKDATNGEQVQYHSIPSSPMSPGDVFSNVPQPIGKPSRSLSTSSAGSGTSYCSDPSFSMYPKAPGSERSERSCSKEEEQQAFIRKQILSIESDPNLDESEKARRKQSLISTRGSVSSTGSAAHTPSSVSAMAPPFYPAADTVESVVESALDDLNLDDFDVSELEKELNSTSPVSASFGDTLCPLSISPMMSAPVSIPGSVGQGSNQSYTPQSPTSPLGQFGSSYSSSPLTGQSQKGSSNPYRASPLVRGSFHGNVLDPLTAQLQSPNQLGSPQLTSPLGNTNELQHMNQELMTARTKLASWEESWTQAKQACDAWKTEAEASSERAKHAEQDKEEALVKRDEVDSQVTALKQEIESLKGDAHLHAINKISELKGLPVSKLRSLQKQLTVDLEKLNQVMYRKEVLLCRLCQEQQRCVVFMPCSHCCLCLPCANSQSECPTCHTRVVQRTTIVDIEL